MDYLIGWLVLLPLLGAGVLLTGGRRLDRTGHWIGTTLAGASFVGAAVLFFDMLGRGGEDRALHSTAFTWISVGGFHADVAFRWTSCR